MDARLTLDKGIDVVVGCGGRINVPVGLAMLVPAVLVVKSLRKGTNVGYELMWNSLSGADCEGADVRTSSSLLMVVCHPTERN